VRDPRLIESAFEELTWGFRYHKHQGRAVFSGMAGIVLLFSFLDFRARAEIAPHGNTYEAKRAEAREKAERSARAALR
jgi:hypothetical protein